MTPNELAKAGTEHAHQRALFAWVNKAEEHGFFAANDDACYRDKEHCENTYGRQWAIPELADYHAIPNGGMRDKITAGKLKAEGVKAGIPDTFLPVARRGFHGLYIEMKKPGEKPTADQKKFLRRATERGYHATWCDNWVAAANVIIWYLTHD